MSAATFEKTGDHMREFYKISQISLTGFMNPQILHGKLGNLANFQWKTLQKIKYNMILEILRMYNIFSR